MGATNASSYPNVNAFHGKISSALFVPQISVPSNTHDKLLKTAVDGSSTP